mgnify:CR=1 FL=1
MYRDALAIRKSALGDNHPEVAISLNNYAGVLQAQGKLAEAERIAREIEGKATTNPHLAEERGQLRPA